MKLSEFIDRLSGRWALTYWQGFILLPIGFIVNISRGDNYLYLTKFESLQMAVATIASGTIGFFISDKVILRNRKTEKQDFAKVIYAYTLIWFAGTLCETLLTLFYFKTTLYVGPQIVATYFPTIFGFLSVGFIIGELSETKNEQLRLLQLKREFENRSKNIEIELVNEKMKLIATIKDYLLPQLRSIREEFLSLSDKFNINKKLELASKIEEYSTNTVRHISHDLNIENSNSPIDEIELEEYSSTFKDRLYKPYISVKSAFFITFFVGGIQQLGKNGLPGFTYDLFFCIYIVLINSAARSILERINGIVAQWIFFLFYIVVTTLGAFQFYKLEVRFLPKLQFNEANYLPTLRLIVGSIIVSILITVATGRRNILQGIVTLNEEIAEQSFEREKQIINVRKQLSATLHGPIQGRLAGIAMLIRLQTGQEETNDNSPSSKIIETLDDIYDELFTIFGSAEDKKDANIYEDVMEIQTKWSSFVKIDTYIAVDVYGITNLLTREACKTIVNESIANAVRHGKASTIEIYIDKNRRNDSTLKIKIVNDGLAVPAGYKKGVGSDSIGKISKDWRLQNTSDAKVTLEAII